jgi:hypothetical protein
MSTTVAASFVYHRRIIRHDDLDAPARQQEKGSSPFFNSRSCEKGMDESFSCRVVSCTRAFVKVVRMEKEPGFIVMHAILCC